VIPFYTDNFKLYNEEERFDAHTKQLNKYWSYCTERTILQPIYLDLWTRLVEKYTVGSEKSGKANNAI